MSEIELRRLRRRSGHPDITELVGCSGVTKSMQLAPNRINQSVVMKNYWAKRREEKKNATQNSQ